MISMSFNQFVLKEQYQKVKGLGDRLELMKEQIDWEPFVPLVRSVFYDDDYSGGRPHTDEIIVVRSMLLQSLYGLSDPELEFQCHDRLSFRNFLGFPEIIPDFTTIWKIRDKLKEKGSDDKIWNELQRQLEKKDTIKKNKPRKKGRLLSTQKSKSSTLTKTLLFQSSMGRCIMATKTTSSLMWTTTLSEKWKLQLQACMTMKLTWLKKEIYQLIVTKDILARS